MFPRVTDSTMRVTPRASPLHVEVQDVDVQDASPLLVDVLVVAPAKIQSCWCILGSPNILEHPIIHCCLKGTEGEPCQSWLDIF